MVAEIVSQRAASIPPNSRPLTGRKPRFDVPAGAIDCHVHLYLAGHEPQPGGPAIPELATVDNYRRFQQWLGLERVVITQPNAYQFDNSALLEALDDFGPKVARAVAVVTADTPAAWLRDWHDKGVRGARIMNLPGGAVKHVDMLSVDKRIRAFGWHLMVQFNGQQIEDYLDGLNRIEGRYIIDHIGKFMPPVAAHDRRVDAILRLLDRGNAWFKLCGPYETSLTGAPHWEDSAAIAKRVIAHAPERVIWGSNWPHVGVPRNQYPDDVSLLEVLDEWANESQRQRILVANPAELYGFDD